MVGQNGDDPALPESVADSSSANFGTVVRPPLVRIDTQILFFLMRVYQRIHFDEQTLGFYCKDDVNGLGNIRVGERPTGSPEGLSTQLQSNC